MATPVAPVAPSTGFGGIAVKPPGKIETRLFINDEFKDASDGKTFKVINPANLDVTAQGEYVRKQDLFSS
ncbi:hypothetical protein BDZ85DRAFT_282317 [Elsinoe ampelina]|uniref:Uncharacterized protein n=1 Tax=Elsinoe ampelina TaxID=302913 RepID=A0A6A6G9I1_9PEZI|nr:hypothetical protein BDZ85DRAFT_282317 [Elsinoe ampelina]